MSKPKNNTPDPDIQVLEDIRSIAQRPEGQRLLFYFLSLGNIYSTTFTGNSETFFLEGKRAIALHILDLINNADPHLYIKLQQLNGETHD